MLLKDRCSPETILHEHDLMRVIQILVDLGKDLSTTSRTRKLWIKYMELVRILLFIRAEHTGDWALHLFCVAKMIPVLHSGGHIAYAKSTRLYLDQMKDVPKIMAKDQYEKNTACGYWTIRRSHRFWYGGFTDQTIEQVLMRMFKVRGGLAHGRGITTSTQAKVVHSLPQTIPVCDSLESFCGEHSQTSDQHSDLWATSTTRDGRHIVTFCNYCTYGGDYHDGLVSISTGVVAAKCSSADCAVELGIEAAARLTVLMSNQTK